MKTSFREILIVFLIAAIIFTGLRATVQSFIVYGPSMETSFHDGQRILVIRDNIAYAFHEPERGDVVIFNPPPPHDSATKPFIKRIIGLPDEIVEIKMETVYISDNGEAFLLDERAYIENPPNYTFNRYKVPENTYFVLGDNRNNSNDSHNNWTVPRQNIIGKAWLSIWPPNEWGLASTPSQLEQLAAAK